MSTLTHTEYIDRFIKSITKPAPAVPTAVTAKLEPSPQAPPKVETPLPPNPEAEFRKRYEQELEAIVEFERNPGFFDDSEIGVENAKRIVTWIRQHGEYPSRQTVAHAIRVLSHELTPLRQTEPVPPPVVKPEPQARVQQPAPVAPTPPPVPLEEPLPPVSSYVMKRVGNEFKSYRDVKAIPTSIFSELYKGPHAAAFKARIDEILRRVQGR